MSFVTLVNIFVNIIIYMEFEGMNNFDKNTCVFCSCTADSKNNVFDISPALHFIAQACGLNVVLDDTERDCIILHGANSIEQAEVLISQYNQNSIKRAMTVYASNPAIDAISVCSETSIFELKDGEIQKYTVAPEQFGIKRAQILALRGATEEYNRNLLNDIFKGKIKDAKLDFIALNAGFMLYMAGAAKNPLNGIIKAYAVIKQIGKSLPQ